MSSYFFISISYKKLLGGSDTALEKSILFLLMDKENPDTDSQGVFCKIYQKYKSPSIKTN